VVRIFAQPLIVSSGGCDCSVCQFRPFGQSAPKPLPLDIPSICPTLACVQPARWLCKAREVYQETGILLESQMLSRETEKTRCDPIPHTAASDNQGLSAFPTEPLFGCPGSQRKALHHRNVPSRTSFCPTDQRGLWNPACRYQPAL